MKLSEFFLDGALRGPPVQCSVYYYEWRLATTNEGGTNVAKLTGEDIIVAFNSRMTPARLEVPVGKYTVVCKDGVIDVRGLGTQIGPEVIIPGQSALIMYK